MGMGEKEQNFVSAVVYLRNNGTRAVACLQQLYQALERYFQAFELVAVDDGSTDDSMQAIRQWATDCPMPLQLCSLAPDRAWRRR